MFLLADSTLQKEHGAQLLLPAPQNPRYQMLDIWRGIACLMIVVLHSSFYFAYSDTPAVRAASPIAAMLHSVISRFGSGVHLFFVISGYCIAATVDASRRRDNVRIDFFVRRFRRIFPPYWFAVLFTIGLVLLISAFGYGPLVSDAGLHDTGVLPQPASLSPSQWIGNLTLTEHWRYHLFGTDELKLLGPSWSLCYEEQFYAICGLILLLAPRRFFGLTLLVSGFTLAMMLVGSRLGDTQAFNGFFFDGRWLLFAVGLYVYHHVNYAAGIRRLLVPAGLTLALISLVAVRYVLFKDASADSKSRCFELIVASSFGLILIGLHRWDRQITALPILFPFAWCGRMCYSLYLIHWPISKAISGALFASGVSGIWQTLLISVPLCLITSLAASYAFYVVIERRYMNTSRKSCKPIHRETALAPVIQAVSHPA